MHPNNTLDKNIRALTVEKNIEEIYEEAICEIENASDRESLETLSVRYLGRKGFVTLSLRNVSSLPADERPAAGKRTNEVKNLIDSALKAAIAKVEREAEEADPGIDITLPGRSVKPGSLHPLTRITMEICDIFSRLGLRLWKARKLRRIITTSRR